ncbi:MAG: DNA internalization-related competence protein ComEC/Rec2 [Gammaproteobacteria bacterium]|nr:MAG: DNA internalization-related competence protein ComEC/Rec2 [Gammaproteobacteria bacterium]
MWVMTVIWVVFAAMSGAAWLNLRAALVLQEQLASSLEGRDLRVNGVVMSLPRALKKGQRFQFRVDRACLDLACRKPVSLPQTILLSRYQAGNTVAVGQRWALTVRLKRPHGFQNPGGFDYEAYLFRRGIRARGYVRAHPPAILQEQAPMWGVDPFRARLGQAMRSSLSGSPYAGVLGALANGDRQGITTEQWRTFRATGTSHLMAISGLHIGLVATWVFFLWRRLWAWPGITVLWWPAPKTAALAALVAALVYAALAGFSIPTQRALIMATVVLLGIILQRRWPPRTVFAIALGLVLLLDPLAVASAGFWLSFIAVAVILHSTAFRFVRGQEGGLSQLRRGWHSWGRIQWMITIGLLPVLAIWFGQSSWVAPVANLIMIPVFSFLVVPMVLIAVLAWTLSFSGIASLVWMLAAKIVALSWPFLHMLEQLQQQPWFFGSPSMWTISAALVGIAMLLVPRGWPGRWLGIVWLLPLLTARPSAPATGEAWLTLLDVGQGLSAVVRTRQHTLVYDTGARFSPRFNTGEAVVAPYLRSQGIHRLDTLIISHGDNDHIGGAASVLKAYPDTKVLTSLPRRFAEASKCQTGQRWQWDGVDFIILHPGPDSGFTGNNNGCVLSVHSPYGSVLLPGDIERRAEVYLVGHQARDLHAQILVAPHHGSNTSSTAVFLRTVNPRLVLLPVGYRNRYRHPHANVLQRYTEQGAAIMGSPRHGAITVRLRAVGIEVESYREQHKRFWFDG